MALMMVPVIVSLMVLIILGVAWIHERKRG